MKIAAAARNPDNEIVGIGTIGVGDDETVSRAEIQMRDPADPLAPGWTVTLQFDPPISKAVEAPGEVIQILSAGVHAAFAELQMKGMI
jgi:hypothetical protein